MAWFNVSYLRKKQITIDHTKVSGSSDLSSFPVLISRTDANLKTVGNGGLVQNSSGFDIIFTDSAEATKLDHEIEQYVASTGEIEMWVRIPTLSHTADTIIYLYYDNSAISTSQENATGVWDSNYKGVWHLKDGTTLSLTDSTSNAANGTNNAATATSGKVDGGANLSGSSQYISMGNTQGIGTNDVTGEAWVKAPNSAQYAPVLGKRIASGTFTQYMMGVGAVISNVGTTGQSYFWFLFNGSTSQSYYTSSNYADGNWHHVVWTRASGSISIYVDGTSVVLTADTPGSTALNPDNTANFYIGYDNASAYLNAVVDEARMSIGIARSSDWIITEYNNQNSPSTFYSVGSAQSQSPGVHFRIFNGYGGVFS